MQVNPNATSPTDCGLDCVKVYTGLTSSMTNTQRGRLVCASLTENIDLIFLAKSSLGTHKSYIHFKDALWRYNKPLVDLVVKQN